MENNKKTVARALFGIFILEFIVALVINLSAFNLYIRIVGILLMIASIFICFKEFKKININTITFLVLSLLYGVSVLPNLLGENGGLELFSIILSFLSASWLGYIEGRRNEDNKFLVAIYGSMFIFGIVSLFATLFSYGFFFGLVTESNTVEQSAKMWIVGFNPFVKENRVFISVFGYQLSLLASGLMVLWANKKVGSKDVTLRKIALASGVLGIVGLITMPYLLGFIITIVSIGLVALIMYFPKEKKKRLIVYIGAGVVALLAVVVIILKGDDIARIKVGIDVLKNVFKYPLGNQPAEILGETPNTRNIYLDALYQNGIPSFMLLVGITVVVAITLIKYYKHSNDSQIKKNLILSYIIHYFVYVNLNYGQVVFSDLKEGPKYSLPLYLDPTLLIVLLLAGYMIAKNNFNQNLINGPKEN